MSEASAPVDFAAMNCAVIEEFRANGGRAGGMFEGKPLVLVHHRGARSGTERIAPLVALIEGERVYIFASKGGADTNPDWYHNLLAHPDTRIELGTETLPVRVREITGPERDEVYARQVAAQPQFGDYEKATSRTIPVLELQRS
ncbi:nitroreductase family deazaflavin-dependent oxidoreductase [Pseudonocardia alni]|uniref:Deazaflavin-dependent oxidoreductase (Nitroreductase family) n=1 Tax=Pseudonocardia alni TaxID=33907 RepID=A0A852VW66_PSEA5|nr:nitroreductase family deazaflavin-dependent oxidoreductase [Pseudonocardia antarctica]NYG01073.1 deazaflavin-dependent oxidoreductase (nitroreductase family) [Pseudonocardia antarctica]